MRLFSKSIPHWKGRLVLVCAKAASTYQATAKEHDGDRHMLQIPRGPLSTPIRKVFEESIACAVGENHKRLGKLARRNLGLPPAHDVAGRLYIPGPAKVGPAAHPPSERQDAVPEENPTLDEVRNAVENLIASLQAVSGFAEADSQLTMIPPYVTPPVATATKPNGRTILSITMYTISRTLSTRLETMLGTRLIRNRSITVFCNQRGVPACS